MNSEDSPSSVIATMEKNNQHLCPETSGGREPNSPSSVQLNQKMKNGLIFPPPPAFCENGHSDFRKSEIGEESTSSSSSGVSNDDLRISSRKKFGQRTTYSDSLKMPENSVPEKVSDSEQLRIRTRFSSKHSAGESEPGLFDEPKSPTASKLQTAETIARQSVLDPVVARLDSRLSRCRDLLEKRWHEENNISQEQIRNDRENPVSSCCNSNNNCVSEKSTETLSEEFESLKLRSELGGVENDELLQADQDTTDQGVESRAIDVQALEEVRIVPYVDETQMGDIMRLITKDLSEPYSIYTYRYFIHNWPELCFLAEKREDGSFVGAIVCKLDLNRHNLRRGYIAMLAVDNKCRRQRIGSRLVSRAIEKMKSKGCDEVVLETEVTNEAALRLYENLGFVRDKRLFRYYLNGVDAFRLKLWLTPPLLPSATSTQFLV